MKIGYKILGLALISNLVLAALLYLVISHSAKKSNQNQIGHMESLLLQQKREYLKDIVESAHAIAEKYAQIESEESVQQRVAALLSAPRYDSDSSAYFFAYKIEPDGTYSFAFHATNPALNGKKTDITAPDPNGVQFRKLLIEGALKGGSFVEYVYQKGKEKGNIQPKLSYARHLPKWNWVLVGGIYLDNVAEEKNRNIVLLEKELKNLLKTILFSALFLTLISFAIAYLIAARISAPIVETTDNLSLLSLGNTDFEAQIKTNDELARMQKAMLNLRDSIIQKTALAKTIAQGDLTQNLSISSEKDELGLALKTMSENLNRLLGRINDSAKEVNAGASQVSEASQSLSEGATVQKSNQLVLEISHASQEQATGISEITDGLHQVDAQTQQNSASAEETASSAEELSSMANEMLALVREFKLKNQ